MGGPRLRLALGVMLAAPLCLGLTGAALGRTASLRCSLMILPLSRHTEKTYFVATALADTVLAGPGDVRWEDGDGSSVDGPPRVYGQLVRVDTLGGADAEAVRAALRRLPAPEAVVVPWAYDSMCRPVPWGASARWVNPGLTGFYRVRPRPAAQWVEGRPTFDAFAAWAEPYPHGFFYFAAHRDTWALHDGPSLSPTEMFSLYEALPTHTAVGDTTGLGPLLRWAAEHPELARKYPAETILTRLKRLATHRPL